jgi:hypothetical protein
MYYKQVENNIILSIGTLEVANDSLTEITETEYKSLLSVMANKPVDTLEYIYRLSAETNQYEPFTRTHDETVDWYVGKILNEEMIIDEVPETYREEVKAKLPNNDYGIDNTTYNNIIDDYTMELVEKGVI